MKKKALLIAGVAIVAVAVLGIAGLGIAATQSTGSYPPIVNKLAERFNLKPADVNAVFEEERKEIHAQHVERHKSFLEQAVKDGKITEKQKAAILAKSEELQKKTEELRALSPEERRDAMQKLRTEVDTWAKDNDVDARYLMMGGKGFRHGPRGFGHGPGGCGFGRFGSPPVAPDTDQPATQSGMSL